MIKELTTDIGQILGGLQLRVDELAGLCYIVGHRLYKDSHSFVTDSVVDYLKDVGYIFQNGGYIVYRQMAVRLRKYFYNVLSGDFNEFVQELFDNFLEQKGKSLSRDGLMAIKDIVMFDHTTWDIDRKLTKFPPSWIDVIVHRSKYDTVANEMEFAFDCSANIQPSDVLAWLDIQFQTENNDNLKRIVSKAFKRQSFINQLVNDDASYDNLYHIVVPMLGSSRIRSAGVTTRTNWRLHNELTDYDERLKEILPILEDVDLPTCLCEMIVNYLK